MSASSHSFSSRQPSKNQNVYDSTRSKSSERGGTEQGIKNCRKIEKIKYDR